MINRVDNNNSYHEYTKVNTHKNDIPEEQFTLDYANSGVIYEKEPDKVQDKPLDKGVKLDLTVGDNTKTQSTSQDNKATVYIRKAIEYAKEKLTEFLNFIWPSDKPEESVKTESVEQTEAVGDSDSNNSNRDIDEILKSGDISELESYLSENGEKTLAKNSGLLTFYDRTGKIVNVDSSDSNRILHGDRNTWQL